MAFPRFGGKIGGVLSIRTQVTLDSLFASPVSAPIGGGKKGEFRDWLAYPLFNVSSQLAHGVRALLVEAASQPCIQHTHPRLLRRHDLPQVLSIRLEVLTGGLGSVNGAVFYGS